MIQYITLCLLYSIIKPTHAYLPFPDCLEDAKGCPPENEPENDHHQEHHEGHDKKPEEIIPIIIVSIIFFFIVLSCSQKKKELEKIFASEPKGTWTEHQCIDMANQGDKELVHFWQCKGYSVDNLKRIVEQKGYSAICLSHQGAFPWAALKSFSYQVLPPPHSTMCQPTSYQCTFYIYYPPGTTPPTATTTPVAQPTQYATTPTTTMAPTPVAQPMMQPMMAPAPMAQPMMQPMMAAPMAAPAPQAGPINLNISNNNENFNQAQPKQPVPKWEMHKNMDMCGQGDVEIIHDWRNKHSIEDLKRIVEQKGYSAISVGNFGHAALKKFNYQLTINHCKPTEGYTNEIWILNK